MPIPKLEITNPEALELIRKIKSREIFIPLVNWLKKYKWYLVSAAIIFVLIIALAIGKKLSESNPVPVFTPPEIESPTPVVINTPKSTYSDLRNEVQNLNTDLPDPAIPVFENDINLEESTI